MPTQVWGTFSVSDHCRPNAFVSDVLIYDQLVIPVPPDDAEADRWVQPNEKDPEETWDPKRQQDLLAILGTQKDPGEGGAQLARTIPWTKGDLGSRLEKARSELTAVVSNDLFWSTRQLLSMDENIPHVVEAVAAYPDAKACADDRQLHRLEDEKSAIAEIGAVFSRPLLVPNIPEDPKFSALAEALELATDPEFRNARDEYHAWVRKFCKPLQESASDKKVNIDRGSLALAEVQLNDLLAAERQAMKRFRRRKWWNKTQQAFVVVGLGAAAVTAFQLGIPAKEAAASTGLLGWVAGRLAAPPANRPPLTGASMFELAERDLAWLRR